MGGASYLGNLSGLSLGGLGLQRCRHQAALEADLWESSRKAGFDELCGVRDVVDAGRTQRRCVCGDKRKSQMYLVRKLDLQVER